MSSRQGASKLIRGRLCAAVIAVVVACLTAPAAASAGSVALNGGELSYLADTGQANTITVTSGGGTITVRDEGHAVVLLPFTDADERCSQPSPDSATCPATSVDVDADDQNDTIDGSGATIPGTSAIGGVFFGGGDGDDRLIGSGLTDTLAGDNGRDTVEGRAGDDFATGGDGDDTLTGGDGNDSFEIVAFATFGNDAIDGGTGDDTLVQPQREAAGTSDGADSFTGGPGRDRADYSSSGGALTLSLDGQPNDGAALEGDNIAADVEDLTGGPAGDTITGSGSANLIEGGGGDDSVSAGDGNDEIQGGADAGSDTLDGGGGEDRLLGGQGDDKLAGGADDDAIEGGGGTDTEAGGEGRDSVAGGPGTDTLSGGPGDDSLRGADAAGVGGDGADTIHGDEGRDRLSGEGGNDTVDGGPGPDVLSGGEGKDAADFRGGDRAVEVTIDDQDNDGGTDERDNVASDVEDVNGSNFNSTVFGTDQVNALTGGEGEDYTDGAAGADTLVTGARADTVRSRGDGVSDTVDCGPGPDFVIADPGDDVRDSCERADRGTSKPKAGKTVVADPAGISKLTLPGVQRTVPLSDNVGLPVGFTIDPAGTSVSLVAATRGGGSRQTGSFSGTAFIVKQPGRRVTQLVLAAPLDLSKCGRRSRNSLRSVRGRAKGRFSMKGRNSLTTVSNATWTVEDRCDGTLTRVSKGTVTVRARGRTKKLKRGQSYLAERRGNR